MSKYLKNKFLFFYYFKIILIKLEHHESITTINFSDDEKLIASSGTDHFVCLWDTETGKIKNKISTSSNVMDFSFNNFDDEIAIALDNGYI